MWVGDRTPSEAIGAAHLELGFLAEWEAAFRERNGRPPALNSTRALMQALRSFYAFLSASACSSTASGRPPPEIPALVFELAGDPLKPELDWLRRHEDGAFACLPMNVARGHHRLAASDDRVAPGRGACVDEPRRRPRHGRRSPSLDRRRRPAFRRSRSVWSCVRISALARLHQEEGLFHPTARSSRPATGPDDAPVRRATSTVSPHGRAARTSHAARVATDVRFTPRSTGACDSRSSRDFSATPAPRSPRRPTRGSTTRRSTEMLAALMGGR